MNGEVACAILFIVIIFVLPSCCLLWIGSKWMNRKIYEIMKRKPE